VNTDTHSGICGNKLSLGLKSVERLFSRTASWLGLWILFFCLSALPCTSWSFADRCCFQRLFDVLAATRCEQWGHVTLITVAPAWPRSVLPAGEFVRPSSRCCRTTEN
jgi:hypothetical protein